MLCYVMFKWYQSATPVVCANAPTLRSLVYDQGTPTGHWPASSLTHHNVDTHVGLLQMHQLAQQYSTTS